MKEIAFGIAKKDCDGKATFCFGASVSSLLSENDGISNALHAKSHSRPATRNPTPTLQSALKRQSENRIIIWLQKEHDKELLFRVKLVIDFIVFA